MTLPAPRTPDDVQAIRDRERVIGWAQGAGITAAAFLAWNLIGWIPVVGLVGLVGYGAYRLARKKS